MTERMSAFTRSLRNGSKALMPFFTAGFPSLEESREVFRTLARTGADCLEIGVPFSDPLADGPTIQKASEKALSAGTSLSSVLNLVRTLRDDDGLSLPIVVFGYYNPIFRMGLDEFAARAAEAGADAALVPDLPLEESGPLEDALAKHDLDFIHLAAPTSTDDRIREIHRRSGAFVYAVSLTGVTGARDDLPPELPGFIRRIRGLGERPVVVGFGVKTPEQARSVGGIADGVVVGSAFIEAFEKGGADEAGRLAASLKDALPLPHDTGERA